MRGVGTHNENSLTRSAWEAEGALDELLRLKQEGKARFIGVSGILPNLAEQVDSGVFDTFQIPYSALQRDRSVPRETLASRSSRTCRNPRHTRTSPLFILSEQGAAEH